ncbi:serine--tRNA ligase [Buchnera aphidicola (Kurisakia onigurumii)]|uniref:serine--tRNA ligase n=1 Tax=Buchnera aphidicola TaxID=9 RepID=UPI0031B73B85
MLDPKLLRKNLQNISQKLHTRGFVLNVKKISQLEKKRKYLQITTEKKQFDRNNIIKLITEKIHLKQDIKKLKKQVKKISLELIFLKKKLKDLKKIILDEYCNIPNIPAKDVPIGKSYLDNKEIYTWGIIKKFNFLVQDHVSLGNKMNGLDWESGSKITGSRFVIMKGKIALLHRALGQFMLDIHTQKHKYLEVNVPYIINEQCLYGTGQLPRFKNDLFHIFCNDHKNKKENFFLIPTGEVPLTNLIGKKILKKNQLPIKLTTLSTCFRSESTSHGLDTRGLIRMRQFDKVELIQIVQPQYSMFALEEITSHAEKILQMLQLPYRKVILCSGDLSFSSLKTYDLEVWFPFQKKYREVSSCSNTGDFQSRRIKSKYIKKNNTKEKEFVHTLNGSGLAVGRVLASILENNQTEDGKVLIPKILREKYMFNLKFID